MGKGFNNYMCKKFFHPASRDNLKRVWMAEQKSDSYKKKQEELRMQYEKEQDLYTNKAMLSKESKDKLSVNFMYEPPPGAKKEREREDNEPEYKFEWQRKFNAPREDYCKGDQEIRDQPFGIQVRNVRCIKCHKWGHINTDKECPMYNQSNSGQPLNDADPLQLIRQMREDGLTIKRGVLEAQQHLNVARRDTLRDMIPTDDEEDEAITPNEKEFLKSLTKKQKMKLLRKLEKMEEKKASKKNSDKKKKSKSKGKEKKSKKEHDKNGRHSTEDESSSEEEWVEEDEVNGNKRDRKDKSEERRKKKKRSRSSSDESSEEERDDEEKRRKEKMRGKGEREYHKNGKSSGSKHRNSRNSEEDESEDEERRERSSRKHTERRNRKENDRKRRSSPDSDYESDHAKRRRK